MKHSTRVKVLAVIAVFCLGAASQLAAQNVRIVPFSPTGPAPYNPNYYIAPGLTVNQYAYNMATIGRAMQQIPPYALGYNPYPQVLNTGPRFGFPNTVQFYTHPYGNFYVYPGYIPPYAGTPIYPMNP